MPDAHGAVPVSASTAALRGKQDKIVEQLFNGPEPTMASPELQQRWRTLREVQRGNAEVIVRLQREHQAGLDPVSLLQARLEAFIAAFVGDTSTADGQDRALRIEEIFENQMAGTLKNIQAQVTQAKLAQGTALDPRDMAALAQQSGLLRKG